MINVAVSSYLYNKNHGSEAELHKHRVQYVRRKGLFDPAEKLGLNRFVFLSEGEKKDWVKSKPKILEDTYEALVEAVFLDQGFKVANDFVLRTLVDDRK